MKSAVEDLQQSEAVAKNALAKYDDHLMLYR